MAISPDPSLHATLQQIFPALQRTSYAVRVASDISYNCISWVMGSEEEWWWPTLPLFWPVEPREMSVTSFARAFASRGFEPCPNPDPETGYAKIALYVANEVPTHAARIESATLWSSKLGTGPLIEHEPHALDGPLFGSPRYFFRRKL
jgi:hypothetical protein